MKKIPVELITKGMVLGKPIFTDTGQVLLWDGAELKESYIEKLKNFKIREVFILNKENGENNL